VLGRSEFQLSDDACDEQCRSDANKQMGRNISYSATVPLSRVSSEYHGKAADGSQKYLENR
jgi:hypothetical protein